MLSFLTTRRENFSRSSTSSTLSDTLTCVEEPEEKNDYYEQLASSIALPLDFSDPCAAGKDVDIDVRSLGKPIRKAIAVLNKNRGRIVGILASKDKGCWSYAKYTEASCKNNGVEFERRDLSDDHNKSASELFLLVRSTIRELCKDPKVVGLMVYFPILNPEMVSPNYPRR